MPDKMDIEQLVNRYLSYWAQEDIETIQDCFMEDWGDGSVLCPQNQEATGLVVHYSDYSSSGYEVVGLQPKHQLAG